MTDEAERLYRELSAIIRADIMTEMEGVTPTHERVRAACVRSVSTLMSPMNVRVIVSDDLQRVTIEHEGR